MSTHTKERWIFGPDFSGPDDDWSLRVDNGSKIGGYVISRVAAKHATDERKAAMSHACDCHNALANMNPAALAGVVEAATRFSSVVAYGITGCSINTALYADVALKELRDALSALTNGAEVPAPQPVNAELLAAIDAMPRPSTQESIAEFGVRILVWQHSMDRARSAISRADAQGAVG